MVTTVLQNNVTICIERGVVWEVPLYEPSDMDTETPYAFFSVHWTFGCGGTVRFVLHEKHTAVCGLVFEGTSVIEGDVVLETFPPAVVPVCAGEGAQLLVRETIVNGSGVETVGAVGFYMEEDERWSRQVPYTLFRDAVTSCNEVSWTCERTVMVPFGPYVFPGAIAISDPAVLAGFAWFTAVPSPCATTDIGFFLNL